MKISNFAIICNTECHSLKSYVKKTALQGILRGVSDNGITNAEKFWGRSKYWKSYDHSAITGKDTDTLTFQRKVCISVEFQQTGWKPLLL